MWSIYEGVEQVRILKKHWFTSDEKCMYILIDIETNVTETYLVYRLVYIIVIQKQNYFTSENENCCIFFPIRGTKRFPLLCKLLPSYT